jgi:hypothetical protein
MSQTDQICYKSGLDPKLRVGIHPSQSHLKSMTLIKSVHEAKNSVAGTGPATETVLLTGGQADYLQSVSRKMNPQTHPAFGLPHAIRAILDRVEASGVDLTGASSEDEIAEIAAGAFGSRRRAMRFSEPLCASESRRSTDRRGRPWIPPATDRFRSEKPPR